MRTTALLSTVALAFAAAPLAAQSAVPSQRVVASYALQSSGDLPFPRQVTVADSAGSLVAQALDASGLRRLPLTVTVLSGDLILQGTTSEGVLTLVLNRGNDGSAALSPRGIWTLGEKQGTLIAAK
jgi:hypothetical protein